MKRDSSTSGSSPRNRSGISRCEVKSGRRKKGSLFRLISGWFLLVAAGMALLGLALNYRFLPIYER